MNYLNYEFNRDEHGWVMKRTTEYQTKKGETKVKVVPHYFSDLSHLLRRMLELERGKAPTIESLIDHDNAVLSELLAIAGVILKDKS